MGGRLVNAEVFRSERGNRASWGSSMSRGLDYEEGDGVWWGGCDAGWVSRTGMKGRHTVYNSPWRLSAPRLAHPFAGDEGGSEPMMKPFSGPGLGPPPDVSGP